MSIWNCTDTHTSKATYTSCGIALHCITLHCITLNYATLNYITLHTSIHSHTQLYRYIYIHMYIHIYMYVYLYIHMYIYIHVGTHGDSPIECVFICIYMFTCVETFGQEMCSFCDPH